MCSTGSAWALPQAGCPIRRSPDQRLLAATRGLSQQRYVLHRLLVPRHPPCALSSLTFLSSLDNERSHKRTPRARRRRGEHARCRSARFVKMRQPCPLRWTWLHADLFMVGRCRVTKRRGASRAAALSVGGDGRARTGDPLLAKQVLSQLSYIPGGTGTWAFLDSNQRPHGYQPCALTN
jgi:hypothetical protein